MAIKVDREGILKKYGGGAPVPPPKPAPAAALAGAAPPPKLPPAPAAQPPKMGPLPTLQKTAIDRLVLDRTGVDKQFDANRQRVGQVEAARLQQGRDALARRAAQLGGGPGGAFIKQEQLAMDESAQRQGMANMEIDAAKDAELRRMGEFELQLNEQRSQAQAAMDMEKWKTDVANELTKHGMDLQSARDAATLALEEDKLEWMKGVATEENKINTSGAILGHIQNLKTAGYTPEQIDKLLSELGLEGLGVDLSGIQGVTDRPPVVMPTGGGLGNWNKAYQENKKNGYTQAEMEQMGFPRGV